MLQQWTTSDKLVRGAIRIGQSLLAEKDGVFFTSQVPKEISGTRSLLLEESEARGKPGKQPAS